MVFGMGKKKSDSEELKDVLMGAFGDRTGSPVQSDSIKELETAKVVLGTMMNPHHLNSTTNLREEEIEDIANALMMDEILDCPMIRAFCTPYLELKRSQTDQPKNMLSIMSEIVGHAIPQQENTGLSRILGGRFKT
jgi:hypothetical protein